MRRIRVLAAVTAAVLVFPATAAADDPPFVNPSAALPPVPLVGQPAPPDLCPDGRESCVHRVIADMYARFNPLAAACDHDAMFSLTYLRTTEEYHRFWHEDQFADPAFLNHYDAVFADYYFRPFDAWRRGDRSSVPPAWREAFEASELREVSGSGSLLLGISAHINRDLPFVIERIGLVAPDGSSRKPDHDKVNEFLNRVGDDLYPELVRRFDPTVDDGDVEGTWADNMASFQVITSWRETAWRNAELLAAAPTAEARALVAQRIEGYAESVAKTMRDRYRYSDPAQADARDAHCRANRGAA